jgi:D-hexose-6-phosphate mutarotase
VIVGRTLTLRLSVVNVGDAPLCFEEALHSYFAVSDVEQVFLEGLGGTEFLDKTDGFARKRQQEETLRLIGETDRPYLNTQAIVQLHDPDAARSIVIEKRGSKTTVVWNPWSEKGDALADMAAGDWRGLTCVETANVADNAITLQPNEAHVMEAKISVEAVG